MTHRRLVCGLAASSRARRKTGLENRFSDSNARVATRQDPNGPHNEPEMRAVQGMPWGVAIFLVYALVILAGVGLSLGLVVDQATNVPVTPLGLVMMALLAYTIFTITVVLQRKAAARGLALGLSTLAVPAIPLALVANQLIAALFVSALAVVLFRGLRAPAAAAWLDQP
jgi:F0F1-type ATP synthase assembly protein I